MQFSAVSANCQLTNISLPSFLSYHLSWPVILVIESLGADTRKNRAFKIFSIFVGVLTDSLPRKRRLLIRLLHRKDCTCFNIKMDLKDTGRGCIVWIHLARGGDQWRALSKTVMNFRIP
jgi:hypothetical protein